MPDQLCVNCGYKISAGLAILYRGKGCPNCRQPWQAQTGQAPAEKPGESSPRSGEVPRADAPDRNG